MHHSSVNFTLAYDAAGNMTTDGENYNYEWDAFGRLVRVKNLSTQVISEYSYNGLGYLKTRLQDTTNDGVATTYGTYPDSHEANPPPLFDSDVVTNWEKLHPEEYVSAKGVVRAEYDLTPEEEERLRRFIEGHHSWWSWYNCAGFAEDVMFEVKRVWYGSSPTGTSMPYSVYRRLKS